MNSLEKTSTKTKAPTKTNQKNANSAKVLFTDPQLRTFFRSFWNEENYAAFFLATRDELFLSDDSPKAPFQHLPYLFFLREPRNASEHGKTIINAIAEAGESIKEQLYAPQKSESADEDIITHMSALVLFHLHRILKKNPVLHNELLKEEPSYASILRVLKQNWNTLSMDVFDEINKNQDLIFKNELLSAVGDPALLDALAKFFSFAKELQKDYIDTGKLLNHSHQREAMHIELSLAGYERQSHLFPEDEIYDDLLGDMYAKKLISTIGIVSWCSHCVDEPFVGVSMSQLSPQQASFKCPKCRHEQCVTGAFKLNDRIRDIVFSKDGVISGAVAWLLNEQKISFEQSKYVGDVEIDFMLRHRGEQILVECKQHKGFPEGDFSSFHNNIVRDAAQLKRAKNDLIKEETAIDRCILLVNYEIDATLEEEIDKLRQKHKRTLTDDIVVMDCQRFHAYITKKKG